MQITSLTMVDKNYVAICSENYDSLYETVNVSIA